MAREYTKLAPTRRVRLVPSAQGALARDLVSGSTAVQMHYVIIVEDDALLAADFVGILEEAGHQVVGVARTLEQSLRLALAEYADIALIDVDGPGESESLDIARLVADRHFMSAIFIGSGLSWEFMHDSRYYRPSGFVEKPYTASAIVALCARAETNPLAPGPEITVETARAQTARRSDARS